MADLTKTITNSLNLFGGSPSDKWQAYNWNAFLWGEGTADLPVAVTHLISETLTLDSSDTHQASHTISESLSLGSDNLSETLEDGHGYFYVFPPNTTNHENQALASYTVGSSPNTTWTSSVAGSTVWS